MAGKPLKKKVQLHTEPDKVRKPPKIPLCPRHQQAMRYEVERGLWTCEVRDCAQIAFPPDSVSEGKPVLAQGALEVVLVKDPDGGKMPRVLLRTISGRTVVMDISDHLIMQEHDAATWEPSEMMGDKVIQSKRGTIRLTLELHDWIDAT